MAENRGGFRPTAPQNNPANVSATGGAGQSGTQPAPTERPDEPITAGMDFGAGPGSEALNLPAERSLSEILASMIDIDPTGEIQELYDFVAIRGL